MLSVDMPDLSGSECKKISGQTPKCCPLILCCIVDNNRIGVSIPRAVHFWSGGAKMFALVQNFMLRCKWYFCAFSSPRGRRKKRNTAHIKLRCRRHFLLGVVSRGENLDGDSRSEPERIHEYFAFVYIRQLGVAVIKLFKNLFLLVRKRCLEIVVMVCDVLHKLFCFRSQFAASPIRANVSVPQFFKYTSHKCTSL